MKSSEVCAKENECSDSDGNRCRSSLKPRIGDDGTEGRGVEGWRVGGMVMFMEVDREVAAVLVPVAAVLG